MSESDDDSYYESDDESNDDKEFAKECAFKFKKELLKRSVSKDWNIAKDEWIDTNKLYIYKDKDNEDITHDYSDITDEDVANCQLRGKTVLTPHNRIFIYKNNLNEYEEGKCICGHRIKDECIIENTHTKYRVCIGNHCIRRIGTDSSENLYKTNRNITTNIKKLHSNYKNALTNPYATDADYSAILKKPSPTLIKHYIIKKLITQEESIFLENFPKTNKKNTNLPLESITRLFDINIRIINTLYKAPQYDNYKKGLLIYNCLDEPNKIVYLKNKFGPDPSTPTELYYCVIDTERACAVYILDPNGKKGEFKFINESVTYERGFIRFEWKQIKLANKCIDCNHIFHVNKNEEWMKRCTTCFKRQNDPEYDKIHIEPQGTYTDKDTGRYTCILCNELRGYKKFRYEIQDITKTVCQQCAKL